MKKLRYYISPYFVFKSSNFNYVRRMVDKYNLNRKSKILDVGCGSKPYRFLFSEAEYTGIDFENYSLNKDYQADSPDVFFSDEYKNTSTLPFPDNHFDTVVSFQVLEHHPDPEKMVSEIVRVCKPDGHILLTVPFLGGLHEEPFDFQRYTKYGLRKLIEKNNCRVLDLIPQGKFFTTIYMLVNEYTNYVASLSKFHYLAMALLYFSILLPVQYLSIVMDKLIRTDIICYNYTVCASKRH